MKTALADDVTFDNKFSLCDTIPMRKNDCYEGKMILPSASLPCSWIREGSAPGPNTLDSLIASIIRTLRMASDSFFHAFMKPWRTHGTPAKAVGFLARAVSKSWVGTSR